MLYVYLKQSAQLEQGRTVRLRDVAQLCAVGGKPSKAEETALASMQEKQLTVTAGDVVAALGREDVTMLGAPSCIVSAKPSPQSRFSLLWKTVFVAALLFLGGGMTILSYQTDVAMPDVHSALSKIFTGDESNVLWITLPYCIGVGAGVLFFSNVLPGRKKSPSIFDLEQFQKQNEVSQYVASQAEEEK